MTTPTSPVPPHASQPYPYAPPTNTKAILALVFAFLFPPVGIVMGHLAHREIRRTGEGGKGLATAGLVLSYVWSVIGFLIVVLVIIGAAAVGSSTPPAYGSLPGQPGLNAGLAPLVPASAPDSPAAPSGPASSFDEGSYEVGTDIQPGTYKTTGSNLEGLPCYWARYSDTSGEFSGLITNELGNGPMVVTVKPSDAMVQTSGCNTWHKTR